MASDNEILTVKEVCELLRVHPTTIYKLIGQGKIPCFRIGSDWRFRKDRIRRWMAQQTMGVHREKSHRTARQHTNSTPVH